MKKLTNFVAVLCSLIFLCFAATGNSILAEKSNEWIEPRPPATEYEPHRYYLRHDLQKLSVFFGQEDPDGVKNGEKVMGYYSEDLDFPCTVYTLFWNHTTNEDGTEYYYNLSSLRDWYMWGGWDMRNVDYYGDLDLSATTIKSVTLERGHISNVKLNYCWYLNTLNLNFSNTCRSVSAVDANIKNGQISLNSGIKNMTLGLYGLDSDVKVSVLGNGNLGAEFHNGESLNTTLRCIPNGTQPFIGWLEGGVLIPGSTSINVTRATRYVAAFAGDVNGDGIIGTNDAVLLLREAMGIIEINNAAMSDVNCDGLVTITDAIMLMRATMGELVVD